MSTFTKSFLDDLQDFEDENVETEKKQEVSDLFHDPELQLLLQQVKLKVNEFELLNSCNRYVNEIDLEIRRLYDKVVVTFSQRFADLGTLVVDPISYLKVVIRIGEQVDLSELDFSDILDKKLCFQIKVVFAMNAGRLLTKNELDHVFQSAEIIFQLHEFRETLLNYLESRMHELAPNLVELLGSNLTAHLITRVGSIKKLAEIPAQNIQVLGSKRGVSAGSNSSLVFSQPIIFFSDIVQEEPEKFRKKAFRLVSTKTALLARIDCFHKCPDGSQGVKVREQIKKTLEEFKKPPPTRHQKPLPVPMERTKPKRGGERHRRMKRKLEKSVFQKKMNRLKFTHENVTEDITQEAWDLDFGLN